MNPSPLNRFVGRVTRALKKLMGGKSPSVTSAEYWDAKYETEEFIYTKVANRFVIELCADLKPGMAIDLAGGEGRNTVWLAEQGWQVENSIFVLPEIEANLISELQARGWRIAG